ncbi:MAG: cation transporter [Actinobacteria bacterium]|nr:cation transporter [Actinomycetota bacterium]
MAAATAAFSVTGMHCASCGLLIDDAIEEMEGVASCATDARRGRTVVRFDPAATSPQAIAAAIAQVGYRAETAGL